MRANTFVEREPELEQLQHFLSKASVGQGQVCFVTGEAASLPWCMSLCAAPKRTM
ncbi:MAG TPA: hypothetical protein PKE45_07805 [Caldilineaceae bacterium]|nr:hypothetical protein [Caldilineaceae bacterium]